MSHGRICLLIVWVLICANKHLWWVQCSIQAIIRVVQKNFRVKWHNYLLRDRRNDSEQEAIKLCLKVFELVLILRLKLRLLICVSKVWSMPVRHIMHNSSCLKVLDKVFDRDEVDSVILDLVPGLQKKFFGPFIWLVRPCHVKVLSLPRVPHLD